MNNLKVYYCILPSRRKNSKKCSIYTAPADYWDKYHTRQYLGEEVLAICKAMNKCGASGAEDCIAFEAKDKATSDKIINKMIALGFYMLEIDKFTEWSKHLDGLEDF